jgi:hypothetical protein
VGYDEESMTLQPIVPARPRPARCVELILTWQFLIDASPTVRAQLGRGITDATHTATEAVGSREAGDGVLTVVGEAKHESVGAADLPPPNVASSVAPFGRLPPGCWPPFRMTT